jgi:hypothetical protein
MILHLRVLRKLLPNLYLFVLTQGAPGGVICVTVGGANPPKVYLVFPSLLVLLMESPFAGSSPPPSAFIVRYASDILPVVAGMLP